MLFAVHISNGLLTQPWVVGGFVVAAGLLAVTARLLREDELPRIALVTAALFIASSIHIPLGPVSVHLLLNGLAGVLLGWSAVPAIAVGLFLQAILLGHGGFDALGVNTCVLALPALLAFGLSRGLHRAAWLRHPAFRSALVGVASLAWFVSCVYSLSLLSAGTWTELESASYSWAGANLLHPLSLAGAPAFACGIVWFEKRLDNAPEFPIGLLVGELTVLATVALNCAVLIAGGADFGPMPPLVLAVAHLPVAVVEGVILGFAVGFLAKVKPEMLGIRPPAVLAAPKGRNVIAQGEASNASAALG